MKKGFALLLSALLLLSVMAVTVSAKTEYAELTDEELYQEIDSMLARPRMEGEILFGRSADVSQEELSSALATCGLPNDFSDRAVFLSANEETGAYCLLVSEEQIRDVLFTLHRCEQICLAFPNYIEVIPEPKTGDVNLDDAVDAKDYMMLKRHVLGTYALSERQQLAADVNMDGTVNAKDYLMLKRMVLGSYVPTA